MKAKIKISIDEEVLKQVDEKRGIAKRSTFINEVLKKGLKIYKGEKA